MKNVRLYQNIPLLVGEELTLDAFSAHHLAKVLRFPTGQNITLFNGDGMNYSAKVLQSKKECTLQILEKIPNSSESKLHLSLAQGVAKGEKMDFLIQKAVELGVNKIIPILTEYCVVKLKGEKLTKRQFHWQKIVISACEQSARSVVPEVVTPINLTDFLQQPIVNGFVLHHRSKQTLLKTDAVTQATILIGPEGGLSKAEITQATQAGYQSLLLGTRILRTETASLAAIANMQLLWGS
ncbi:Ribosomal RNA small subunit methyltransferase E [Bathymodiolus heckerae thiotrophic gill symbiont]|uniref:16S rRNA (uracil(1498)-N(3))-methyltransferase n=1 Tax=Bathymodiolus heckerae thiotrophic gill symbiont TaxID=1052212 RepID=UPI0010B0470B|nr:16S rRNA (uracil(1498)-N(3))-methyltransferase [Bathymodiolus heckerae thiotrophic gill symbiont]SMN13461.1 Ribosomal RNA small subunit methyltransferase E [Bathymodiolus heckerae thiotrophic gill symbiont]SMN15116.1 Ribosomal RNA small subunit methyltransferase E [uncultured Candidatus Thioglobus sp.]